jgi:hypothetical protein
MTVPFFLLQSFLAGSEKLACGVDRIGFVRFSVIHIEIEGSRALGQTRFFKW